MKQNNTYKDLLHSVGLKATNDRMSVLKILEKMKRPMSAQDIKKEVYQTDLVTIYRSLEIFKKKGVVRQVNISDERKFFEIATSSHHHHIVCERCGFVEKIDECFLEEVLSRQLDTCEKFAKITEHTFEIFGICKKCK